MRYAVMVGEDPDTAKIITGPPPLCSPILYTDMHDACEAANLCVKGGSVPAAFVVKLVPAAFYLGVVMGLEDNDVYVDETVLEQSPERSDN